MMEGPATSAGEQSLSEIIEGLQKQAESMAAPERQRIPWNDGTVTLTVINIPVGLVLLNPISHRIKAQLTAHPARKVVQDAPFSEASQAVIATLLRETEDFEKLKCDLEESGQTDPGVITRQGVLLNANTRAVALRELHKSHIRVMVLPVGATASQLTELELRLQVKRDFRQEYTFTNKLLFIRDCLAEGWTITQIGKVVYGTEGYEGPRNAKVERDLRMLAMIDELISMSKGLTYPMFDVAYTAIYELDDEYEKIKGKDAKGAQRLRVARQVAILCGVGYRQIRHIDDDFVEAYLREEIEADERLTFLLEETQEPEALEGIDLLGGDAAEDADAGLGILKWLADTADAKTVQVKTGDSAAIDFARIEIVEVLQRAIASAAESAQVNNQRGDMLTRPKKLVEEARKRLKASEDAFMVAGTDPRFGTHAAGLLDALDKLQRGLESIRKRISESPYGVKTS